MDVQRTRTRNLQYPTDYQVVTTNITTNKVTTSLAHKAYQGKVQEITDVNHKRFNARMKLGEIMIGPLAYSVLDRQARPGVFDFKQTNLLRHHSGDLFPDTVAPAGGGYPKVPDMSTHIGQLKNSVAVSVYNKLNGSSVAGGENFAEMRATVQMLRRPFGSAQTLIHSTHAKVQRWIAQKPQRRTKAIMTQAYADSWLELKYGLLPLIGDSMTIMEDFSNASENLSKDRFVVRAGGQETYSVSASFSGVLGGESSLSGMIGTGTRSTKELIRADAGVFYCFYNNNTANLIQRTLGLRGNDALRLAWDLVPLSFVVDWWAGVGDWITAAMPDPNMFIVGQWMTIIQKTTETGEGQRRITCDVSRPDGSWLGVETFAGDGGGEVITTTTINRVPSITLPQFPVVNLDISSLQHALTGLALTRQRISGLLKFWQ